MFENLATIIKDALKAEVPGRSSGTIYPNAAAINYTVERAGGPLVITIILHRFIMAQTASREGRPSWNGGFFFSDNLDEDGARRIASRIARWLKKPTLVKPEVVIALPQPKVAGTTYIVIPPAEQIGNGDWRGSARIIWPDGSYDLGASGLIGKTRREAEVLAETKACERWAAIESGDLNKSEA